MSTLSLLTVVFALLLHMYNVASTQPRLSPLSSQSALQLRAIHSIRNTLAIISSSIGVLPLTRRNCFAAEYPSSSSSSSSSSSPFISEADLRKEGFYMARAQSLYDADSYRPGLKYDDVYYPDWLRGDWRTVSNFTEVSAPLGEVLFGGKSVFETINKDLNSALTYKTSIIPLPNLLSQKEDGKDTTMLISDRVTNVEEISRASMGPKAKITLLPKDGESVANKMHLLIQIPTKAQNFSTIDATLIGKKNYSTHNIVSSFIVVYLFSRSH